MENEFATRTTALPSDDEHPAMDEFDAFFREALADLKNYSTTSGSLEWSCPPPDIIEFNGAYHIRFFVRKIVPESVRVSVKEDELLITGMRWAAVPGERWESIVPFSRSSSLPKLFARDRTPAISLSDESLLLVLPKNHVPNIAKRTPTTRAENAMAAC